GKLSLFEVRVGWRKDHNFAREAALIHYSSKRVFPRTPMRRSALLIYLSLLAVVVVFFHKPLFSAQYMFPWDFRGVQLPLITFLTDELRQGRFALWNPYSYCGY